MDADPRRAPTPSTTNPHAIPASHGTGHLGSPRAACPCPQATSMPTSSVQHGPTRPTACPRPNGLGMEVRRRMQHRRKALTHCATLSRQVAGTECAQESEGVGREGSPPRRVPFLFPSVFPENHAVHDPDLFRYHRVFSYPGHRGLWV